MPNVPARARRRSILAVLTVAVLWHPATASAAQPGSISPPGPAPAAREARSRRARSLPAWLRQYAPQSSSVELAITAGAFFPSAAHELYDERAGFHKLARATADLGGRIDYFALRWFGFEFEGDAMPTHVRGGGRAWLAGFRGGLVLRLPWRLAPFLVGGIGALAVSSSASVLGDDIDASFHVGAGLQFFVNRWFAVRVDGRDNISHRRDVGGAPAHHPQAIAGFTFRFGTGSGGDATAPPPAPADHDGDRIADAFDHCPAHAGSVPDGCPRSDRDGDGFADDADACADIFGTAPMGCPAPSDDDGDGLLVPDDRCPDVRGSAIDGCPLDAPQRRSGEVTAALADLEGVLAGVTFTTGSDELTTTGRATLSRVADVLQGSPGTRVEIVGHTDDRGSEIVNRTLSARRAESVVRALVDRGVAAERLVSRGAGGDEPIASNATADGRATNRRVELIILRD